MTVQMEFWNLVALLLAFFGAVAGAGKLLLAQFERRLDERFTAQEAARAQNRQHWDERFARIETAVSAGAERTTDLERQLLTLKAELPIHYVRREDYVQGQSVIMARLDALYSKLETLQLRGNP